MPNPLLVRRLLNLAFFLLFIPDLFISGSEVLGAGILFGASLLRVLCLVAEICLICRFGAAVRPLTPPLRLAGRLRLLRRVKVSHLARVGIFGALATGVFFALPDVLRHTIMPTAGGFTPDNIGAAALGAFQFFAALSMAYASWRFLFPGLYAYAVETMEGKLLESITTDLVKSLQSVADRRFEEGRTTEKVTVDLIGAAELRKIATLTFFVRCARFAFSVSPFVFFFVQANHALASALIAVPPAAAGL